MTNSKDQTPDPLATLPKSLQSSVRLLSATKKLKETTVEKFDKDIAEAELNILRKLREIARKEGFVSDFAVHENLLFHADFVLFEREGSSQFSRDQAKNIGHNFFLCASGNGKHVPLFTCRPPKIGDVFDGKTITKITKDGIFCEREFRKDQILFA